MAQKLLLKNTKPCSSILKFNPFLKLLCKFCVKKYFVARFADFVLKESLLFTKIPTEVGRIIAKKQKLLNVINHNNIFLFW